MPKTWAVVFSLIIPLKRGLLDFLIKKPKLYDCWEIVVFLDLKSKNRVSDK